MLTSELGLPSRRLGGFEVQAGTTLVLTPASLTILLCQGWFDVAFPIMC